MTFFLAISARSCAPFQFFTLQDLVRGECDVWFFYEHDLAFVPFSFFHPLHVGEQSVEYPQWVISIQRTKAIAAIMRQLTPNCLQPNLLT